MEDQQIIKESFIYGDFESGNSYPEKYSFELQKGINEEVNSDLENRKDAEKEEKRSCLELTCAQKKVLFNDPPNTELGDCNFDGENSSTEKNPAELLKYYQKGVSDLDIDIDFSCTKKKKKKKISYSTPPETIPYGGAIENENSPEKNYSKLQKFIQKVDSDLDIDIDFSCSKKKKKKKVSFNTPPKTIPYGGDFEGESSPEKNHGEKQNIVQKVASDLDNDIDFSCAKKKKKKKVSFNTLPETIPYVGTFDGEISSPEKNHYEEVPSDSDNKSNFRCAKKKVSLNTVQVIADGGDFKGTNSLPEKNHGEVEENNQEVTPDWDKKSNFSCAKKKVSFSTPPHIITNGGDFAGENSSPEKILMEIQKGNNKELTFNLESELDFSSVKKKKKKKVSLNISPEAISTSPTAIISETQKNLVDSSVDTNNSDYSYEFLLTRLYSMMREKNPNMDEDMKKKIVIKPPQVLKAGTKKTSFVNFLEIAKMLRRTAQHLQSFLLCELGTTGSVDGNNQLVIKGRFQQKQIETVLRRYIREYVTCHTCHSPDTVLQKDTRLCFLQCQACGSRCSVANIKSGFQALVNKRAAIRAKCD